MKIIEQGHCGGSEQKEGKWPWRHNIGKTTELTKCAHVSAKNRHAHIPSERQLWAAVTGVFETPKAQRLTAQGFCPKVYPEQWWKKEVQCLMNIWWLCWRPVAKISSNLNRITQTKISGQYRPSTNSSPYLGRENTGFLPVIVRQARGVKHSNTGRGFKMLSKQPLYLHCTLCVGTRQAWTIYQCRKEIIHKMARRERMEE